MTGNVKEVINIAEKAIASISASMKLYDETLDKIIPWKTYEDTMQQLNSYIDDYSDESGKIVGKVKTLIMNAQDKYFAAAQTISGWCGVSITLLEAYLTLLAGNNPDSLDEQKQILLKVLDKGIIEMDKADDNIEKCSEHFNLVAGQLVELSARLNTEFDPKDKFFNDKIDKIRKEAYGGAAAGAILGPFGLIISYSIAAGVVEGKLIPELQSKFNVVKEYFITLKTTINTTNLIITDTKAKLADERRNISDLRGATDSTKFLIDLDGIKELRVRIEGSLNDLINLCKKYREHHGVSTNFKLSTKALL